MSNPSQSTSFKIVEQALHPYSPNIARYLPVLELFAIGLLIVNHARADERPFDAWARTVAYDGPWKGVTVQAPVTRSRPDSTTHTLTSQTVPVSLHCRYQGKGDCDASELRRNLEALEHAYVSLRAAKLPLPPGDGVEGGDGHFDVYLTREARDVRAYTDGADLLSAFDGCTVFGTADANLSASVSSGELQACMSTLVAQAGLLALDGAESEAVRGATAAYFGHLVSGQMCERSHQGAQERPDMGLFTPGTAASTGLFLAVLSERQDRATGAFVASLWQFAQQDSKQRTTLRASPDFLETLDRALDNAGESLNDLVLEFNASRYFAGREDQPAPSPYQAIRTLPDGAAVPVAAELKVEDLPHHHYADRNLNAYGSAYLRLDTRGLDEGQSVEVWLRGSYDALWGLTALRMDKNGRELGRLHIANRPGSKAFLPIRNVAGMTEVVLVVTRLPRRLLDPDERKVLPTGYKLILNVTDGAPTP